MSPRGFEPPIEVRKPGFTWCATHGTVKTVDHKGKPADIGLCEVCFVELHAKDYTTCGEHGIQPRKKGSRGCGLCKEPRKPRHEIPPPPLEAFGDTTSEPPRPGGVIEAPPSHTPAPAHRVEPKPDGPAARPDSHEGGGRRYKYSRGKP